MNDVQNAPWEQIAAALADKVERLEGFEGALVGAGLGAAAAIASLKAVNRKIEPVAVLAAAAAGIAYGAVRKGRIATRAS